MRSFRILSLGLSALLLLLGASVQAGEGKGSDTKGKFYFKKSCKACHVDGGSAKALTPLSKTQGQWKKFFEAGKHKGEALTPKLGTPEQMLDIKTFLINHASDSPQPETCGG
ncbi:MAG TPA: cytochrome c [Holophagaceae bacterium]|nr:cytochrome c [Holophagaceae bacterium]